MDNQNLLKLFLLGHCHSLLYGVTAYFKDMHIKYLIVLQLTNTYIAIYIHICGKPEWA